MRSRSILQSVAGRFVASSVVLLAGARAAWAEIRLPSILGDGMVHGLRAELFQSRRAFDDRDRDGEMEAELRFESVFGLVIDQG